MPCGSLFPESFLTGQSLLYLLLHSSKSSGTLISGNGNGKYSEEKKEVLSHKFLKHLEKQSQAFRSGGHKGSGYLVGLSETEEMNEIA